VRISLSSIAQADEKASSTFTSVSNLINRPYRLLRYSTFDKMLIWSVPSTPGYRQSSTLLNLSFSLVSSLMKISPAVAEGSVSVYALVKFPVNKWICFCVRPYERICNLIADNQFFGWGASLCIMSAFTSFTGLAIFRFILGAFEASISPSMRT
jgi:hypothetical protein